MGVSQNINTFLEQNRSASVPEFESCFSAIVPFRFKAETGAICLQSGLGLWSGAVSGFCGNARSGGLNIFTRPRL